MSAGPAVDREQPLIEHLLELRSRLIKVVLGVFVVGLPLLVFAKDIYGLAAQPLVTLLPAGNTMIATAVASPFFAPIKLALIVAVVLSMPWTLWQIWSFIAPGLYKKEQKLAAPLMISSTLLFYAGIAFAYFAVFPMVFRFMVSIAPEGVAVMTDINEYLDFVLGLSLAFGLAFETPVAVALLVRTGFVSVAQLKSNREYVFLGAFIIGAIFTPPDVASQVMLALSLYALFELGIVVAAWMTPKTELPAASS